MLISTAYSKIIEIGQLGEISIVIYKRALSFKHAFSLKFTSKHPVKLSFTQCKLSLMKLASKSINIYQTMKYHFYAEKICKRLDICDKKRPSQRTSWLSVL